MPDQDYEKGLELRRHMLGKEGADDKMNNASEFIYPLEEWVTRQCFGEAWHRPGLDHKTRSMLTLAILTTLGEPMPLKNHVRGALANGVTAEEIREVLMHTLIYAGVPRAVGAFLAADEVLRSMSGAGE